MVRRVIDAAIDAAWAVRRFLLAIPGWVRRMMGWIRCGVDPWQIWSLDTSAARWLAPRLELLRDLGHGHPVYEGMADEIWFAIVDKMAQTFRFAGAKFEDDWETRADVREYVSDGLDLFAEFFFSLWD